MLTHNAHQRFDQVTNDLQHAIATTDNPSHRQHATALLSVVTMHRPKTFWSNDNAPEMSFANHDELVAFFDGDTGMITTFDLCDHCMTVEEGAEGDNVADIGYATSLWPCGTIKQVLNACERAIAE